MPSLGKICHTAAGFVESAVQVTQLTASAMSWCKFVVPVYLLAYPPHAIYIFGPMRINMSYGYDSQSKIST